VSRHSPVARKAQDITHASPRIIDIIDGTYELFRHFYGLRRFTKGEDRPFGAVVGVLKGTLQLLENRATHVGVATDHVIESFRNQLWPGYKTGAGIEPALRAQFQPLEDGLAALGVVVWPMTELEADDALASAARLAEEDPRVQKALIWTPDKDLAQCVRGERIVQVDRRGNKIRTEGDIRQKFGVGPALIPDYLALVGDAADGYPGIKGIGAVGAARLLRQFGPIEAFPHSVLGEQFDTAMLFKRLATLKTDAPLFTDIDSLRWGGPTRGFAAWAGRIGAPELGERAFAVQAAMAGRA
jgi:5'-3' exonuclease